MTPSTIDDYLAGVQADHRAALERLRAQIHAAAPQATEAISYGRPAFRQGSRYLVGFGSTQRSCSFYVGRAPVQRWANQLTGFQVWKGTINFRPGNPLPKDLVTALVHCRLAEYSTSNDRRDR